ncbi:MAG: DUF1553 domain-containing protein, partial [Rhodopirellula sp.]|nr:DUF1553 domain-containing protein [Rhodopirellula sp.]
MIRASRLLRCAVAVVAAGLIVDDALADEPQAAAPVFEKDVLPIFTKNCFNCHGKSSPQLGLDLRSARLVRRGSQNGPVVVPGSLDESLLWKKVSSGEMPPKQFKLDLTKDELAVIKRWIESGAKSAMGMELPQDVQQQLALFDEEIRPLFEQRCVECHGAEEPEADLDLRTLPTLLRGSHSGPVVYEGFSDKSVLIRRLTSHEMPPPDAGEPLTPAEIHTITSWIDKGRFADFVDVEPRRTPTGGLRESEEITAEDRQFWSFQKPVAADPPAVKTGERVRTPIDQFLLARLESEGLTFSPDAPKLTLLRRAYFDLTGLPPTRAQAQEFLNDERADAYGHLIDRLLASPSYGERWGRHWLDAVGYVDTAGKDFNPTGVTLSDGYWRYRDYVINATNKDTPWDRFLVEQIAGDELVDWRNADSYSPEMLELLTATGFLRNVLDATDEDISNLPFDRYEALFKLMERVSTSTMGMTLACARCHSHKFDPIPQTDYYRFLSLFTSAYNPSDWLQPKHRHLYTVSRSEKARIDRWQAELKTAKNKQKSIRDGYRQQLFEQKLETVADEQRASVKAAFETEEEKRTKEQKALVAKFEKQLAVADPEIDNALNDVDRTTLDELQANIRTTEGHLAGHKVEKIQALWDVGEPPTIRLLQRGDVDFAGPIVEPGFLSALSPAGSSPTVFSPNAIGETAGLRLAFAEWLTSPDHPLTARVIVNRIWQHHFGRRIVATPDNFGATGAAPTHPQLLDWLAVRFMRDGWSAKKLHKLIMTSTAYRQMSKRTADNDAPGAVDLDSIDPDNTLLSRMTLRRLEAESLRDAIIATSGQLDDKRGGPPVMLKPLPDGQQTIPNQQRRSVYLLARRSNPATFMRVFDYPVIDVNCTRRSTSATPLQSLTMINSEFLTASAEHFAKRIQTEAGPQAALPRKIEIAYRLALSRAPSA